MITRLVKLSFKEAHCTEFENYFTQICEQIKSQEGCLDVKLFSENHDTGVFFTLSKWEHDDFLQAYRKSELFGEVWPKVKKWMKDKPEAWTINELTQS